MLKCIVFLPLHLNLGGEFQNIFSKSGTQNNLSLGEMKSSSKSEQTEKLPLTEFQPNPDFTPTGITPLHRFHPHRNFRLDYIGGKTLQKVKLCFCWVKSR